jgi:predicted SAM-dependent methyltransferase
MIRTIISIFPERAKLLLRPYWHVAKKLPYYGEGRFCPVCGKSSRRFRPVGLVTPKDSQCVHCGAHERHRFLWLYLLQMTNLFDSSKRKILHVAPESCFESKFKKFFGDNYVTADLYKPNVMYKIDITDIEFANQSFDVIFCSHVLEHVVDDIKAMGEFFRVLKRRGWAILLVPISGETTFEDPSILDHEARLKSFGHKDHVRKYGRDFVDRLHEIGFKVKVTEVNDLVQSSEEAHMGLGQKSGEIYFCTK